VGNPVNHSSIDVTYFKEKLLSLRTQLLQVESSGNEAAQIVELDQSKVGRISRMDALQGQAMAKESQQRRTLQLQRITGALQRIDKEIYGLCAQCEEEIDPKRLQLDPTVVLCIRCAKKREE
jgi:DnaK suppressor protein